MHAEMVMNDSKKKKKIEEYAFKMPFKQATFPPDATVLQSFY